ncbi:hypothetical protein [Paracoccus saliphilus]|uniref:Uncharacterized protein n=1 Tax=Paracoccus saliphilus TaxID=405559 RepID=A0AA46A765_9RHOB|nr:hypothetical protein [Paracoccus saliphilus]WCR02751.1 hypothetical protein JHX88_18235 [Paracoccus saliphilus]SIT08827.1 hypothetical protein SAMN05421772_1176 [Paracoccus saliphilus]
MPYYWPMPPVSPVIYDGGFYDQIFDSEFHGQLAELMELDLSLSNMTVLRDGHFNAFDEFMSGHYEQLNYQPEKAENARLERVSIDADRLMASITVLYGFGQTQRKLANQIKSNPSKYVSSTGLELASLLDDRRHQPFFTLLKFLSDLQISAERAINRKPRYIDFNDAYIDGKLDLDKLEKLVMSRDVDLSGDPEIDNRRWKDRSRAHKLPKDYPLQCFLRAFRETWLQLSDHPFTEGHYYGRKAQHVSRAVDAVKLSFDQHAPHITRQNIVTAIRKVNAPEPR